ncbi:MAG: ATP-binding protein, partial [Raoultibacter sp.]
KDTVYGVAGLVLGEDSEDFGALEKNLLVAILDECGQAAEHIAFAYEHHQMRMKIEKEALRSNLLRTISHDLRTPLTSISGDADMLISEGEKLTVEQKRQMYRDIYEDSSWLIDLVENLLSVTRIDDGTVNIETQPENAMRHVTRKAETHNIKVDLPDEFLLVNMDARLIMQVIINLVNNAVVYTPEGSHIVVAAKKRREAGKDVVRLTVTDDGPGILDADKERIFDMFYHVELTEKSGKLGDSRRGMGLGLALCRSIVNVHGSEISVRDAKPHGCEFGFDLPVSKMNSLTSGMHDEDTGREGA